MKIKLDLRREVRRGEELARVQAVRGREVRAAERALAERVREAVGHVLVAPSRRRDDLRSGLPRNFVPVYRYEKYRYTGTHLRDSKNVLREKNTKVCWN